MFNYTKKEIEDFLKEKAFNKRKLHSKKNTYHVMNKNIASSKVTDRWRRKRECLPGHPQA